jgi:hypothetical protein
MATQIRRQKGSGVSGVTPEAGQKWRSRDPRDNGLVVTVLDVANGYVRIQRFRKTTVGLRRFRRDYEGPIAERSSWTEPTA